jgi:hypothetical protein
MLSITAILPGAADKTPEDAPSTAGCNDQDG